MATVIKGSRFIAQHTIEGMTSTHLSDDGVDVVIEYFVAGKYATATYTVSKEDGDLTFDDTNPDAFTAVIDTTDLPVGKLSALISVTYTMNGSSIIDKFVATSSITISEVA